MWDTLHSDETSQEERDQGNRLRVFLDLSLGFFQRKVSVIHLEDRKEGIKGWVKI